MSEGRFFKDPADGESAFIKAATEPNSILIDEQTLVILSKFEKIEKIVDEVSSEANAAVTYPSNKHIYLSNLKEKQALLTDFLQALSVYSVGVVYKHPTIEKFIEYFGNYAYYLKTLISEINEFGKYSQKDSAEKEKNAKDTISIFKMSLSIAAADTKKENALRALKQYNDTLHPQPPAKSKRKGGCTIL